MVKKSFIYIFIYTLLVGCDTQSILTNETSEECVSDCYLKVSAPSLQIDGNGYYHLDMNDNNWQTLHRVSAQIETGEGDPVEFFWVEWESDLYWYLGDTLGYIINRHLSDSGVYVSVDTSYMVGFSGMEVPTSNMISYSNSYGKINGSGSEKKKVMISYPKGKQLCCARPRCP